ncbi:hypothetical protein [Kitasatospora sp. LaBMicrA B282]|uniref:hypothetical protein n=1 Tax=Kitasatospora sp. LaBMicrA B282 TaxID=3420949 RepID=UPI003D14625F
MPQLSCHFPITVSITGRPSQAGLAELGRVVEEALAARLRQARQHLETVAARQPAAPVEAGEPLDPDRLDPTGRSYRVPSYEGGGALRPLPLAAAAPQSRDPALLSDPELDTEYRQARSWLLGHRMVEAPYAETRAYLTALEAELGRRAAAAPRPSAPSAPTPPAQPAVVAGAPPRTSVPPPPGLLLGRSGRPAADVPAPVTAAHAGGALGEQDLPFLLGQRGFRLITSAGAGGHGLTDRGFDAVAVHPETGDIWLVDNKSSGALGKAEGRKATALGRNLARNLEETIGAIRAMPGFPEQAQVLRRLAAALVAVKAGKLIPPELKVHLVVTNAGGYGSGARNLPPGVRTEDLVGEEVRAARAKDVATAAQAGVRPGRPSSQAETDAMVRRVGGQLSRRPVRGPVRVRIRAGLRSAGVGLAKFVAVLIWNAVMSRLDQAIEEWFLDRWAPPRLRALEPEIQARVDGRLTELVDLQLRNPGKPLYAVVGILTTIERAGEDDTELQSAELALTSVSVAAERIEHSEVEHVRTHPWYGVREVRDLVRTTYSIELEPLGPAELALVLRAELAAEEAAAGARSTTPEQERSSEQRRDELAGWLRRLEQAP